MAGSGGTYLGRYLARCAVGNREAHCDSLTVPLPSLHWEINALLLRGKAFFLFSGLLPFSPYCQLLALFEIVSRTFRHPFPYKGDSVVSALLIISPIPSVHPHPSGPGWALTTPGF